MVESGPKDLPIQCLSSSYNPLPPLLQDNGVGLEHSQIPDMLGRVLSGTKYGVAQTRGKFGLGAKMALIWSKMSTGLPITVRAARRGSASISFYRLDIDIQRNQPNVHEERLLPNPDRWHGAELSVVIEGNWQYYRSKILKYLQLVAVITPYCQARGGLGVGKAWSEWAIAGRAIYPRSMKKYPSRHPFLFQLPHAQFHFRFKTEEEKNCMDVVFRRRTDVMAPPPKARADDAEEILAFMLDMRTRQTPSLLLDW